MSLLVNPLLVPATSEHRGVLMWRWGTPMSVLSSAPVGGGPGVAEWVLSIGVGSDYDRTDLSNHAEEVSRRSVGPAGRRGGDVHGGGPEPPATLHLRRGGGGCHRRDQPSDLGCRKADDRNDAGGRHDQSRGAVAGRTGSGGGSERGDHSHRSQGPGVGKPRDTWDRDRHRRGHDRVAGRGRCGAVRRTPVTVGHQDRPSCLPGSMGWSRTARLTANPGVAVPDRSPTQWPNASPDRRIGIAFRYLPTHVRQTEGVRESAMLVRGVDEYGNFDLEPRPRSDFDEAARAAHADAMGRFERFGETPG